MSVPGGPPQGMPPMPGMPLMIEQLPPEFFQIPGNEPISRGPRSRRPTEMPTFEQIQSRIDRMEALWSNRDDRMDIDQDEYDLVDATNTDGNNSTIIRNTFYTTVNKFANMVGGQEPIMEVIPPRLDLSKDAQQVEDLLRHMWEEWEREYRGPANHGFKRDMIHDATLRGWIAVRLNYDPFSGGDEFPVKLSLEDPRTVYPSISGRRIRYVAQIYRAPAGVVKDEWPEAEEMFFEVDDDQSMEVKVYYDDTYFSVQIDGAEVKPATPHGYGFVPWVIATTSGAPSRLSATEEIDTTNFGPSILHGVRHSKAALDRLLSLLMTQVELSSNPPVVMAYDPNAGPPDRPDFGAGSTNYLLFGKESVDFLRTSPSPTDVAPLLQILNTDIQRGSLPDVLFGGQTPDNSGFAISLLSGAAKDAVYGVLTTMQATIQEINQKALQILLNVGHEDPVGIVVQDRASGRYVGGNVIYIDTIASVGTKCRVRYRDITPKDEFAMMQMGLAMLDKQVASMHYIRENHFNIPNPEREHNQVMTELPYRDEEFMRDLVPYELWKSDPEMFQFWLFSQKLKQQREMQQMMMMMQGGGMMGMPPGPQGPGGPGGSQNPMAGLNPMPGQPPMLSPSAQRPGSPLGQARGSSAGGAGLQRGQGVSGIGGQVPGGVGVRGVGP